jgi:hypothetical protein
MSQQRKMRAIVALVAAYAVALQGAFLAIGGLAADPNAGARLGASSLCLSSRLGAEHPAPSGHEHGCPAACGICCCSAPATTTSAATTAYDHVPAGLIVAATVIAPTRRFDADRAYRSRAPPLG